MANMTENDKVIMEEFGHLVGDVLTHIEAALSDKVQRESLKKLVERNLYATRNKLIQRLGDK